MDASNFTACLGPNLFQGSGLISTGRAILSSISSGFTAFAGRISVLVSGGDQTAPVDNDAFPDLEAGLSELSERTASSVGTVLPDTDQALSERSTVVDQPPSLVNRQCLFMPDLPPSTSHTMDSFAAFSSQFISGGRPLLPDVDDTLLVDEALFDRTTTRAQPCIWAGDIPPFSASVPFGSQFISGGAPSFLPEEEALLSQCGKTQSPFSPAGRLSSTNTSAAQKALPEMLDVEMMSPSGYRGLDLHHNGSVLSPTTVQPTRTDACFNDIPATCLETGVALAIIQNPGGEGQERIDQFAQTLSNCLSRVNPDDKVIVKGRSINLRGELNRIAAGILSPDSGRLGRSTSECTRNGDDLGMLMGLLRQRAAEEGSPLRGGARGNRLHVMRPTLLKIDAFAVFGETFAELLAEPANHAVMSRMLGMHEADLPALREAFTGQLKHSTFNNLDERARVERRLLGFPSGLRAGNVQGGGFGRQFHLNSPETFPLLTRLRKEGYVDKDGQVGDEQIARFLNESDEDIVEPLAAQLVREVEARDFLLAASRQPAQLRENAPLSDTTRPGIITDATAENLPVAFEYSGLPQLLKQSELEHAPGLNRWIVHGSYVRRLWDLKLPGAGAHSGTTAEILFGMHCMAQSGAASSAAAEAKSSNREWAEHVSPMIAAFMAFGGYHTAAEVLPICRHFAEGQPFEPTAGPMATPAERRAPNSAREFYDDHLAQIRKSCSPGAIELAEGFSQAYDQTVSIL